MPENKQNNLNKLNKSPQSDSSSSIEFCLEEQNMATFNITEFSKIIPEFSGDITETERFLACCDMYYGTLSEATKTSLMSSIAIKLKGDAFTFYQADTDKTWAQFKELVGEKFSDKRKLINLQTALFSITQGMNNIKTFATELERILQKMNAVSKNVNTGQNTAITQFKAYNEKCVLRAFIEGLKDPIGAIIKARDFTTLNAAIEKALEEEMVLTKHNHINKTSEEIPDVEEIICFYCTKPGHKANVCFFKRKEIKILQNLTQI